MQTVHDYIKSQEIAYQTLPVPIVDGYEWNMFDHVKTTTLYLNSKFKNGKPGEDLPFKNIILPKVNLEHRAVQFDLSEIQFYIDSEDEDYKSFLVRKFHERWALQNGIADFLDKLSETYTDYGGVLIKNTKDALEVVPFQRLAFVDQTDMNSGPVCEKHQYSPDQLKDMEAVGWGSPDHGANASIDEVITLAREEKANSQNQGGVSSTQIKAKTPGRYIEVYELHGMLPETFLDPAGDPNTFVRQMQITTSYQSHKTGKTEYITLFAGKEGKQLYKAFKRDEIYGRALGRGAVEELFEPQVWTNYSEIAKTEMLDQVAKILNWTNDQGFKANNDTSDMKSGDVLVVGEGKTFAQLNQSAVNAQAFEQAVESWDNNAKDIAAAQDLAQGDKDGTSNMSFKLGMLLDQNNHSLHQYRKNRLGIFLSEVYRDWVIPRVQKAVAGGDTFLSCLSLDEMGQIVDQVVACEFNKTVIGKVLAGEIVYPDQAQALEQEYRAQFFKNDRKFLTILEGELRDLPLDVEVNIANSSPNALMAEKISAIFTQVTQVLTVNPNFFVQQPQMAKLFNNLLEAYGLSPINFGMSKPIPLPQPPQAKSSLSQPNAQPQVQSQPAAR